MSFQAMTWAVRQKVGSATGKMILTMLANRADENGVCYPGQETLADECECSLRTVREWLSKFEEMGLLRREQRRRDDGYRTSDRMLLRMRDLPVSTQAEISAAVSACETLPAEFSPETDRRSHRQQLPGKKQSVGTVRNHNIRARERGARVPRRPDPSDALAVVVDRQRANQIVEHRLRIGKPLTFSAGEKLASKLGQYHTPADAADAMLANGWQGFDPTWMERRQQRPAAASPKPPSANERALAALDRQLDFASELENPRTIDGHARRS